MSGGHDSPQIAAILLSFSLSVFSLFFAKRSGFFQLPPKSSFSWPTFLQTMGAFLIYLIVSFIVIPILYLLFIHFKTGLGLKEIDKLPSTTKSWLQIFSLASLFLAFLIYCFLLPKEALRTIFWGNKEEGPSTQRAFKDIGMGILTWLISYPLVILTSLLAAWVSLLIWGKSGVEQVAVKQLSATKDTPFLFAAMIFTVTLLVPFIEEFLFRGFLQAWLRRKMGRILAIFLTAVFFACVHFASSQGTGNLELISALFVLSCFLGFIYERQQSLWASMGLHSAFNAISIIFLSLK